MSITDAYAADYNAITHLITLNNVKISGNPNLSTTLTPTDGAGIHAGQVWSLSTGNATGAQDAQYTSDGKLYIPNLVQDAFITYNASFLLTNVAPLEFTVLDITTTSFSNGAETKVVFNQGVKGDAGLQGSQGAQGLKGDTGSQGLKGDTGAIGLKGAAGYQGIDGTTGLQGLTGTAGAVGATGAAGANGANGASGANGLTTSVNGVTQVSGAISLTKANFTDLNNLDNTSDANKPVSTATQTALNLKAPLADPDFTGTPTAATAVAGTSNTQLATTAFVKAAIDLLGLTTFTYKIGDIGPGNGYIFFVDYHDQFPEFTYLEASPVDISAVAWCNDTSTSIAGADGWNANAIGRGQANTTAMLAGCASGAAVDAHAYTNNGKADWFLPSEGELILMYTNLRQAGVGSFAGFYWSSTQLNGNNAWSQYFDGGTQNSNNKVNGYRVRAVRAF